MKTLENEITRLENENIRLENENRSLKIALLDAETRATVFFNNTEYLVEIPF